MHRPSQFSLSCLTLCFLQAPVSLWSLDLGPLSQSSLVEVRLFFCPLLQGRARAGGLGGVVSWQVPSLPFCPRVRCPLSLSLLATGAEGGPVHQKHAIQWVALTLDSGGDIRLGRRAPCLGQHEGPGSLG